jgi:soluble epoxide hydrolase / lipid-phosphate phosphatase
LPKLTYNIYFQKDTDGAIAELDKDIRRSVRSIFRNRASPPPDRFLRSKTSFLKAYDHLDEIPPVPYYTPEEEDYHVEHFSEQGFGHSKLTPSASSIPLEKINHGPNSFTVLYT